jgi:hypothetical protein
VLSVALSSCRDDCVATCPLPVAVVVHVTAGAAAGPVDGAFIRTAGERTAAGPNTCRAETPATICTVPGHAGTYELEVGAPGFQTTRRTVNVPGTAPEGCRCATVDTVLVNVSLLRS